MDRDILRMKLKENTGELNAICRARFYPKQRRWIQGRQFPCTKFLLAFEKEFPACWLISHQGALRDGNDSYKETERCSR